MEETLRRDIERIRSTVIKMGVLVEGALRASLHSLTERDRQLAYSVILKDRYIDETEKELDRLCQELLLRQQPVAGHLRFVYAVIKINNELERIGDYAESIARHYLTLSSMDADPHSHDVQEIANLSIPMLRNAIQAFANQDPELAKATMQLEDKVDQIRWRITNELSYLLEANKLTSAAFQCLMIITNRFERVADRACNVCEEVLYMCTGEEVKHKGKEVLRVLFVDHHDSCRGQMAKGIADSLALDRFYFQSGGISPLPVDPRTVSFMAGKNIDISQQLSKYLHQVLTLEKFQIFVSLCHEAEEAFPAPPTKMISIHWEISDPSRVEGSEEEKEAAYEKTFQALNSNIRDLVEAVLGE
jgi:phosphate transport system protein